MQFEKIQFYLKGFTHQLFKLVILARFIMILQGFI